VNPMISLASEFTDVKGRRAHAWLFFDAECDFCTRIASWIAKPMLRRGLGLAPLQDPRVAALLGIEQRELFRAIRYLGPNGITYEGAEALITVARELWWAHPVVWASRIPGAKSLMCAGYGWIARHRKCHAQSSCGHEPVKDS
jgi:predicted DCC family thiol-disulfide oxidoreductase YuxK